jgi:hypothetical protein
LNIVTDIFSGFPFGSEPVNLLDDPTDKGSSSSDLL